MSHVLTLVKAIYFNSKDHERDRDSLTLKSNQKFDIRVFSNAFSIPPFLNTLEVKRLLRRVIQMHALKEKLLILMGKVLMGQIKKLKSFKVYLLTLKVFDALELRRVVSRSIIKVHLPRDFNLRLLRAVSINIT